MITSLFAVVHFPEGDSFHSYSGMDQDTVTKLVSEYGYPFDFIDEATFNAGINKLDPPK